MIERESLPIDERLVHRAQSDTDQMQVRTLATRLLGVQRRTLPALLDFAVAPVEQGEGPHRDEDSDDREASPVDVKTRRVVP